MAAFITTRIAWELAKSRGTVIRSLPTSPSDRQARPAAPNALRRRERRRSKELRMLLCQLCFWLSGDPYIVVETLREFT